MPSPCAAIPPPLPRSLQLLPLPLFITPFFCEEANDPKILDLFLKHIRLISSRTSAYGQYYMRGQGTAILLNHSVISTVQSSHHECLNRLCYPHSPSLRSESKPSFDSARCFPTPSRRSRDVEMGSSDLVLVIPLCFLRCYFSLHLSISLHLSLSLYLSLSLHPSLSLHLFLSLHLYAR